jgi:N-acetylglutamate synthase-like GNAT family acetyltransferase
MADIKFQQAIIPDDIPALCDFDKRAFHAHPADMFTAEEWKKYETYWMIADGKTVGCVALETDKRDELWIASTAILPEFRGMKFGEKLKQWQIDHAKSHGFSRIGTVMRQSNAPIIQLNKKFGFTPRHTSHKYFSPDEPGLGMELRLPLPECPKCGKTLRTHRSQQCRFCGADWHISPED